MSNVLIVPMHPDEDFYRRPDELEMRRKAMIRRVRAEEAAAREALEQARIREEDEWAKRMIELYEQTDTDALNEHFLSKGEWS